MTLRSLSPLAVLLVGGSLVLAQSAPPKGTPAKEPAKPAPGSLEETLEKALRNSADIKAAEAKVRESEAELNRVRQQVLTRATALHADLNLAKRMLALAEDIYARQRAGMERGISTQEAAMTAMTAVEKHRGEVEKLQTELKSLRGEFAIRGVPIVDIAFDPSGKRVAGVTPDGAVRVWDTKDGTLLSSTLVDAYLEFSRAAMIKPPAVSGSMAERVRKLLDQEVAFEVSGLSIEAALRNLLSEAKSDVPIRAILHAVQAEARVELQPGKLPVGAWIQALEDTDDKVVVVVRDYGLLMTMRDRMPAGAVRVQELWKGNHAQTKKAESPPPDKK